MKTLSPSPLTSIEAGLLAVDPKALFRARFQRALRLCVNHGFCKEESFGMIFNETLDDVPLDEQKQSELYEELIKWAKGAVL